MCKSQNKARIRSVIENNETLVFTPLETLFYYLGWVMILVSIPVVAPPLACAMLWEALDRGFQGRPLSGMTMRFATWFNTISSPFLTPFVKNPLDTFAVNCAVLLGVFVPAFFFYCMYATMISGSVSVGLWLAYNVFRLGPYFMNFAYTYTLCHKEGHSRSGLFKGPMAPLLGNFFNWWCGLFYGVMPSTFAYGHSINHHRYNNGPNDVVSIADKPRDQWRALVAFFPRWLLYAVNISTIRQFINEGNYKTALRVFYGTVYAFSFVGLVGYIAGLQFMFLFLVYPILEQTILLSCVMWSWHGFLDIDDPEDGFVGSVTIQDGPINVLNEDYHVVHHQYPGAHWETNPSLYQKHIDRGEYKNAIATVLKNTHAFEICVLILLRKYDVLTDKFVDLSGTLTRDEIHELIIARVRMCWWGHRKPEWVKLQGKEVGNYDLGQNVPKTVDIKSD